MGIVGLGISHKGGGSVMTSVVPFSYEVLIDKHEIHHVSSILPEGLVNMSLVLVLL